MIAAAKPDTHHQERLAKLIHDHQEVVGFIDTDDQPERWMAVLDELEDSIGKARPETITECCSALSYIANSGRSSPFGEGELSLIQSIQEFLSRVDVNLLLV